MTVVLFIVILAVLVFVHELGHFLAAKYSGIRVDEFGIGFPPKIFSFRKGETLYTLNLIPFGGFVKIFGENPDQESIEGPEKARSFVHKPKHLQALVLIAGIAFNVLFAWILISIGFMSGMSVPENYADNSKVQDLKVTVTSVVPGSPAEQAGLKAGDSILKLSSATETLDTFSITDIQNYTAAHGNAEMLVYYERGSATGTATVTPVASPGTSRATMGVTLDVLGTYRVGFFQAWWEGAKLTVSLIWITALGIAHFLMQIFTGNAQFSQVTGPVGIAGLVGDATRLGIIYLLSFTAYISINLAVINLIPFPALDGGRLLFVLIEKIKGSPISPKFANTVNAVGFGLLLLLMLVVTYHDIFKLFIN